MNEGIVNISDPIVVFVGIPVVAVDALPFVSVDLRQPTGTTVAVTNCLLGVKGALGEHVSCDEGHRVTIFA